MSFETVLGARAAFVEAELSRLLPGDGGALGAAMRHGVLAGGKRLRAFLAIESAALFGVPATVSVAAAAAVECVHAYSLIHDDLPCMDDDDLRRGQPTVHVKWNEATAVLAGDALQALAFEILAGAEVLPAAKVRLVAGLARASGAQGMVGGQAMDIAAETGPRLGLAEVTRLQALKTGALIVWAAESGAILAGEDGAALRAYAADLGLAFQIRDDLLDIEGDAGAAGKRLRKDAAAGKATFVSLLGVEGARARAAELVGRACGVLDAYGAAAANLRMAAEFALGRGA